MKKKIVRETIRTRITASRLRYKIILIGLILICIGIFYLVQKNEWPKDVVIVAPFSRLEPFAQVDLQSMQVAFDESGGKAGKHNVTFLQIDTTAVDSKGNLGDFNKLDDFKRVLADKKTVAVLGPISTGAMMIAAPLVNRAGIAHINPASSYSGFVVPNYGSSTEYSSFFPTGTHNFFSLSTHTEMLAESLAKGLQEKGKKNVYVISGDNSFGQITGAAFKKHLLSQHIAVIANTTLTTEIVESTLSEIEASAPDCIVVAHAPNALFRNFLDGLVEKNLTSCVAGPFLTSYYTSMYEADWPPLHSFSFQPAPTDFERKGGRETAFLDAYEARYGALKTISSTYRSYSAMKLALQAIAESNGTKKGVLEALHNLKSFNSLIGNVTFNEYGLAEPLRVAEVEISDGKVIGVK